MKTRLSLVALALLVVATAMTAPRETPQDTDIGLTPSMAAPDLAAQDTIVGYNPPTQQNFANPCPGPTVFNGLLGTAQAGKNTTGAAIHPTRIFRDGVLNTPCPGRPCPGNFSGGPFVYDVWPFTGPGVTPQCFLITFNGGTCGSGFQAHPSTWCGTYPVNETFPANCLPTGASYLSDSGASPAANANVTFSFCSAGDWSLLVHSNFPSPPLGCTYSFTVTCTTCSSGNTCTGLPPGGGGGGGTCNLGPIEAKLDAIPPTIAAIEAKADAAEVKLDSIETTVSTLSIEIQSLPCQIYRLLSPRLPGKPNMAGSRCLGLLPTTCPTGAACVENP